MTWGINMWLPFFEAVAVGTLFLLMPGIIALRGLRFSGFFSFACAPVVSIAIFELIAIVFSLLRIKVTWVQLFLCSLILSLLIRTVSMRVRSGEVVFLPGLAERTPAERTVSLVLPLLYVCVAFGVLKVFFGHLGGPGQLIQGFDTLFHVNLMRSFAESGDYSPLHATLYPVGHVSSSPLTTEGSFYPAAWHLLAAMVLESTGVSAAVAVNAVNSVFCAVVYPLGMCSLIKKLFPEDKRAILFGSICTAGFVAFPWTLLVRGEQFPQLASFALVPATIVILTSITENGKGRRAILARVGLLLCAFFSLALLQTNGIFTVGIFAIAFVAHELASSEELINALSKHARLPWRVVLVFVWLAVVCVVWVVFYKLPFMASVVSFTWPSFTTQVQALVDVVSVCFSQYGVGQAIFSLAIVWGLLALIVGNEEQRWIVCPVLISAGIFIADVSMDGTAKQLMSGFWYTDPDRTGAMLAMCAAPVAACGLGKMSLLLDAALRMSLAKEHASHQGRRTLLLIAFIVAVIIVFYPSYQKPGSGEKVATPFGEIRDSLDRLAASDFPSILDSHEKAFVEKVEAEVPEGSVVLNVPDDGSAFLYGLNDIDVYYRRNPIGDTESSDSILLRKQLNSYTTNSDVRQALERSGAKYVLVLDTPNQDGIKGMFHTYKEDSWRGIESITPDTPGFRLVASSEDAALFKIEG